MAGSLIARPTTREDVRSVHPKEPYLESWRNLDQDGFEGWLSVYARSFIIKKTNEPIAIAGMMIIFPGVAEGWICMDDRVRPHILSFLRLLRVLKEDAWIRLGLWRLQAPIQATFLQGQHFAECAGLEREAVLRSYFHPDLDAILYSEVRK